MSIDKSSTKSAHAEISAETPAEIPRMLERNLDRNVCTCYDVTKRTIIEAYMNGAITFEQMTQRTYACQGSACCQKQVERLVEVLNETYPSDAN